MSSSKRVDRLCHLHSWRRSRRRIRLLPLLLALLCNAITLTPSLGLDTDGVVLLSFKYSILEDPLGTLANWNLSDKTPCSWHGVTCGFPGNPKTDDRVVGLSLPNSRLSGSIPSSVGTIKFLRTLDLSNNSLNGSLPRTLFTTAAGLRFLDLSNNRISGRIPEAVGRLTNLQLLNLSDNRLSGPLPENLTTLQNLTIISLRNNYFSGSLPSRFGYTRVLDLSLNFISGSLPPDFGGENLNYLNLSHNNLSGEIPPGFASRIPGNATLYLAFNNLTGEIPESIAFLNQKPHSFLGNPGLCGVPANNPCPIPSSPSSVPKVSAPTSTPAIAAIPKTIIDSSPVEGQPNSEKNHSRSGLRSWTIIGIAVGDLMGIGILAVVFIYVYRFKKRRNNPNTAKGMVKLAAVAKKDSRSSTSLGLPHWSTRLSCLRKGGNKEDSSDTTEQDSDEEQRSIDNHSPGSNEPHKQQGKLVTLDGGERGLELEMLLKASAYILGATGSSIMYKAVLEDGTSLAVRRIGESSLERFKDFEGQIRAIARLVHPNLLPVRGFYWGHDEKLIIYDFMRNGSLANALYSESHLFPSLLEPPNI